MRFTLTKKSVEKHRAVLIRTVKSSILSGVGGAAANDLLVEDGTENLNYKFYLGAYQYLFPLRKAAGPCFLSFRRFFRWATP